MHRIRSIRLHSPYLYHPTLSNTRFARPYRTPNPPGCSDNLILPDPVKKGPISLAAYSKDPLEHNLLALSITLPIDRSSCVIIK
uniref:Uncharacterized protein n=1 Tax=Picea glauca TaxID=3330 RepID=A0A117NHV1_PICGL|nr:hypothetical protein ABT39_MTgene4284 [Picea glauca]QHR91870.1 hypothetical protein Q903MT_gene5906 [Picea sitchensis]